MGWWSTTRNGVSFASDETEYVNGDHVSDIMGDAIVKIAREYERVWERSPKRGELRAILEFVLLGDDDDTDYTDHLAS